MLLRVIHQTAYLYGDPVPLGHNQLRLTPRSFERQQTVSSVIEIKPKPQTRRSWTDAYGNEVTYFTLEEPHHQLSITLNAIIDVTAGHEPPKDYPLSWEQAAERLRVAPTDADLAATEFTFDSPFARRSEDVAAYAAPSFTPGRSLFDTVWDLTRRIFREFKYEAGSTTVSTPTSQTLKNRRGVCQDFAHLQIAALRSFGLAARYVSGYLVTKPPPGKVKLTGADASHAWLSVYFPDVGWLDFDPTNDRLAGLDHLTLAWGRDYGDVAPITGLFLGGGSGSLRVSVDVAPAETANVDMADGE